MADVINYVLLTSTIFSLATATTTVYRLAYDIVGRSQSLPRRVSLWVQEVRGLRDVIDECYRTIDDGPIAVPDHVKDLLVTSFEQGKEVEALVVKAKYALEHTLFYATGRLLFILRYEKDLNSSIAIFRDKTGLLRDACSEIRLRQQLVEISAAMSRLTELSMTRDDVLDTFSRGQFDHLRAEFSSGPVGSSPERFRTNPREHNSDTSQHLELIKAMQTAFKSHISSWGRDGYIVDGAVRVEDPDRTAMVLIEDPTKPGGQRFSTVPAQADYYPARTKVDTGSATDLVTMTFLLKAGVKRSSLTPIPLNEQVEVEGVNKVLYKPEYRINLKWYRQGESETNEILFLVVNEGPFEILFSSRRFAEEAEKRLFSLPLVRRRKPRDQIEQEIENEKRRLQEAKDLEEMEFRAEQARRAGTVGRVSTIRTTNEQTRWEQQNDVERDGAQGAGTDSAAG